MRHDTLVRRARRLSWITLVWLAIDGVVGMTAGLTSDSVALVGWGLDCAIEAAAAVVIIWRFTGTRIHSARAERRAQQVVAVSFLLLAPYITVAALDHLHTGAGAAPSWLGIGLAATDAALMPFLGTAKRRVGSELGSFATHADGTQNLLCAYLSLAVLAGLLLNALAGWWWADPVAALLVAVVAVQAGRRTWRGETCE
jgi:divalent metal cation (Fe/Co/Zn/Cd) transporter